MTSPNDRLERAVLLLAELRDPAATQFPLISSDPRARRRNKAEHELQALAREIKFVPVVHAYAAFPRCAKSIPELALRQ